MDARLDPAKYAGLSEGDAHVIRNAGGGRVMTPFAPFRTNF
jgi:carbonic anhydrase